jgi:hypothetical protein
MKGQSSQSKSHIQKLALPLLSVNDNGMTRRRNANQKPPVLGVLIHTTIIDFLRSPLSNSTNPKQPNQRSWLGSAF